MEVKIALFIYSMTPNVIKIELCFKEHWNVKEYKVNNENPRATRKPLGLEFLRPRLWTSRWASKLDLEESVTHCAEFQVNAQLTRPLGTKLIYRKSVLNNRHCL